MTADCAGRIANTTARVVERFRTLGWAKPLIRGRWIELACAPARRVRFDKVNELNRLRRACATATGAR